MFHNKYPAAWIFHANTCRTELNTLQPHAAHLKPDGYKEYLEAEQYVLPEPSISPVPFIDLINQRFSCRSFKDQPLSLQELGNILYAGYGMTGLMLLGEDEFISRPVPSGGGLYSLELYMIVQQVTGLNPGIYHYVFHPHLLEQVRQIELPRSLIRHLLMEQPYAAAAPVIIVASSVLERSMKKYGDRGYRYILFEAGHVFQNMNLAAAACNLGSLNLGGFFDHDMEKLLNIDPEEEIPLYAMALGIPDNEQARIPSM